MAPHLENFRHKFAAYPRRLLVVICLCAVLFLVLLYGYCAPRWAGDVNRGATQVPISVYAICHRAENCAYWYEAQDGEWIAGLWCPSSDGAWVPAGADAFYWQRTK